ncbi:MAG TPA: PIN domain-containing protein [Vicinamibacteria bacterium]|nr:PIN domain-containing protein [Vicinamibacteria bacterium]
MDRLFLDANVLFSAVYQENSGLRRLWELEDVELVTSAYTFEEARPNLDADEQLERLQGLVRAIDLVPESAVELPLGVELSEKDIPILQAALAAEASHLITGDRRDFGRYLGERLGSVWVMTPRQYLETREA